MEAGQGAGVAWSEGEEGEEEGGGAWDCWTRPRRPLACRLRRFPVASPGLGPPPLCCHLTGRRIGATPPPGGDGGESAGTGG